MPFHDWGHKRRKRASWQWVQQGIKRFVLDMLNLRCQWDILVEMSSWQIKQPGAPRGELWIGDPFKRHPCRDGTYALGEHRWREDNQWDRKRERARKGKRRRDAIIRSFISCKSCLQGWASKIAWERDQRYSKKIQKIFLCMDVTKLRKYGVLWRREGVQRVRYILLKYQDKTETHP